MWFSLQQTHAHFEFWYNVQPLPYLQNDLDPTKNTRAMPPSIYTLQMYFLCDGQQNSKTRYRFNVTFGVLVKAKSVVIKIFKLKHKP